METSPPPLSPESINVALVALTTRIQVNSGALCSSFVDDGKTAQRAITAIRECLHAIEEIITHIPQEENSP